MSPLSLAPFSSNSSESDHEKLLNRSNRSSSRKGGLNTSGSQSTRKTAEKKKKRDVYTYASLEKGKSGSDSESDTEPANTPNQGSGNRYALWAVIAVVIVATLLVAGWYFFLRPQASPSTSAVEGSSVPTSLIGAVTSPRVPPAQSAPVASSSDLSPTSAAVPSAGGGLSNGLVIVPSTMPSSLGSRTEDTGSVYLQTTMLTSLGSKSNSKGSKTATGSDPGINPTASTSALLSSSGSSISTSVAQSALTAAGVKAFLGLKTGQIASWYRADTSADSTNGHSWCGFPYANDSPLFAPPVQKMLGDFGGDYEKAGTAYCGLEALVTNPKTGKSMTMILGDGFAQEWVKSDFAIDIMTDTYNQFYGETVTDKNKVVTGVSWQLTGNRIDQWKFKGKGSG